MRSYFDICYLLAHGVAVNQLPVHELVILGLYYICLAGLALCVIRATVFLTARIFGLYAPKYYRYVPRLPWRFPYRVYTAMRLWLERVFRFGKQATGGFAGAFATLSLLFRPGMILMGRASVLGIGLLMPVGMKITRHLFMLAQTGSGKTVALISQISTYQGSVFVIDPKFQIYNALARCDHRQWFLFAPDAKDSICINFFYCIKEAMIDGGDAAAVLWSMRIAEALIVTPTGTKVPYFYEVSKIFIAGVILHVLTAHEEDCHHLPFLRDLLVNGYRVFEGRKELTQGDEAQALLLQQMKENPAFDGVIAGAVSAMHSADGETAGNVRSTLQEQTKWLDLPNVRKVLKTSTISLRDLKRRDDIVLAYCASIYSLREELSPLSRALTNLLAYSFEAEPVKNGSCLFVIDELPSQKHNPTLEVLLAVARSMGVTFYGIAQNIELMKKHYPNSYKSFIGESDATFWMGGNHPDNAQMLSNTLGKTTIVETDPASGRKNYREVPVMDADQVRRFLDPNSDHLIVTRAGARPLKIMNEPYYKALPVWRYAADPDHKEALLRRISRALFTRSKD